MQNKSLHNPKAQTSVGNTDPIYNYSSSNSAMSSARSSVSSLSSEHLQTASSSKLNDGYFNNNYFKVSNKCKLKKKSNSMQSEVTEPVVNQFRGYYSSNQAAIVKRKHSDIVKEGRFDIRLNKIRYLSLSNFDSS